jgi:hypothetical protein
MSGVRILWVGLLMVSQFTWAPLRAQDQPQRATSQELIKRSYELIIRRFQRRSAPQILDAWPFEGTDTKRAVCGEVRYYASEKRELATHRFVAWSTEVAVESDATFPEIYSARCVKRLPDDGSIAKDQAFQAQFSLSRPGSQGQSDRVTALGDAHCPQFELQVGLP